jgi:hypothetical protein
MSPDGPSENGATSDDGLLYTFDSRAPRILPQDPNPNLDVFRAELEQQVAGPFPPANALLAFTGVAGAAGRLIQLDLAGRPTGRALDVAGSFGGAAVDEANALWVAAGVTVGRFQALTLERQETFFQVPGVTRGLAAGGGAVFAAAGNSILRLAPGAEPVSFPLSRLDPDVVALAVDPLRRLWVSVVHPDAGEVLVFTPDLRLSRSFRRDAEGAFRALAFDALGNLAGRAKSRLAKVAAGGGELWSVPLAAGEGVAADGEGNIYTLTDRSFLAFRPDGRLLFSLPHDLGVPRPGTQLAVAGDGSVWAFLEGSPAVLRVLPRNRPPELAAIPIPQALGRQATGDLTGFLAANVTARGGDQDEDGFTNGDETRHLTNPFDPGDPAPDKRLRPIADLRPTLAGGRQVRIDWTSGQEYAFIHVFRDGRQIAGSPFPFDAASGGIVDAGVPGGPHTYRVIGQGNRGAGAGGGLDESGEVPEPFSFSTESTVTLGDGSLRALAPVSPPPDAVAFDSVAGRVLVVHAGGVLSTLDANLQFIEDTVLPADPFASNEVRGLAIDFADAARPLFLLLGDGRIFRKAGAADPVLAVTLNGITPSAAGFSGLVLVNGLFATMIGPDFDCFIGFQRTDGAVDSGTDSSLTTTLGTTVDISIGAARLGAAIIAGTGASPDSTITDIVKLNVAGTLVLTDAHANLPLSAVGSTDIAGFDFAPGLGLVVADRSGSRIAILEATFPGSPQVLTVTPPAGSFSRNTPGVVIAGTGFGTDAGDLWVGFDGVEVPIQGFNAGTQTITITAPALGETRDVEVEVFSSAGSGALASGFIYGFQRGDANDDGAVDISDALRLLTHLFGPADAPPCRDAGDADDSESLEVTDAVRILDFLFRGGPEPLAPFTGFGLDPGGETLGCGEP